MELMSKTIKSYPQTFDSPAVSKNWGMHFNKKIYFCHLAAQWSSQDVRGRHVIEKPPQAGRNTESPRSLSKRHYSPSPEHETPSLFSGFCSALHSFQNIITERQRKCKPWNSIDLYEEKPLITRLRRAETALCVFATASTCTLREAPRRTGL